MKIQKLLILLACVLLITSCQNTHPKKQNILRLSTRSIEFSFDPRNPTGSRTPTQQAFFFEGLTALSDKGVPIPALAEKIDISNNHKTYTFHLRDAKWSNGTPITSYDFKKTWESALSPSSIFSTTPLFYLIKNSEKVHKGLLPLSDLGIKAPDPKTLIVELTRPNPYFLELTASAPFAPLPQKAARHPKKVFPHTPHFATSGPFKVKTWQPDNKLILEKNPFYWDAKNVHLDEVHIDYIEHEMTAFQMFEKGELDFIGAAFGSIPIDARKTLFKEKRIKTTPIRVTSCYFFNTEKFPFNHKKLRQAFSYAINRKTLVEHITHIPQEIATSCVPSIMKQGHYRLFFEDGNKQKARKLFKEALKELNLSPDIFNNVKMVHLSTTNESHLAQALQDQWQKAFGVHLKLQGCDYKLSNALIARGEFNISHWNPCTQSNDPVECLALFSAKENPGPYHSNWEYPHYEQLLSEIHHELNPDKRLKLIEQAEEIFAEEMPAIPLFHPYTPYIHKEYLKEIYISPEGGFLNVKNISIDHSKKAKP